MEYVALNKALSNIQANDDIRRYLGHVSQDAQNETIDYPKTRASLNDICAANDPDYIHAPFEARLTLITNLNDIFFTLHALQAQQSSATTTTLWLWENHTRLTKMIAVAMVLESYNLRKMNVVPERSDIPQSLVRLQEVVWSHEQSTRFKELEEAYLKSMDENGPPEFYELYTGPVEA